MGKKLRLTEEEYEIIVRPVEGQGGFQSLLRTIQSRLSQPTLEGLEERAFYLSYDEMERLQRYSEQYGEGGFQQRLRVLLDAIGRS
ncbi:MAG: hypothetical protein ACE5KV_04495 [Thermoplasmata archaeon]